MNSNKNEWEDKGRVFGWDPKDNSCYELLSDERSYLNLISSNIDKARANVYDLIRGSRFTKETQ